MKNYLITGILFVGIIYSNPMTSHASSWVDEQVKPGQGTVLRFYPQDVQATKDQTNLPQEEKHYFSQQFQDGPKDKEMSISSDPVSIDKVGTLSLWTKDFDTVNTFAITRLATNMWRSTLESLNRTFENDKDLNRLVQYWDTIPHGILQISPYGLPDTKNAYYSRETESSSVLKFGYFSVQGATIYTCRTPDVVAHETGHYCLDRLRPSFFGTENLQTGGLHEAFGDISALSFVFANDTMVDAIISSTKADLRTANNFAAQLAEEFGISLGMHGYLRNADNDYKLSDVENEVHAISEVFTGAYYETLVRAFNDAQNMYKGRYDEASILQDVAEYGRHLILHAIVTVPAEAPNFVDIAKQLETIIPLYSTKTMAHLTHLKDLGWQSYFADEFQRREVSIPAANLNHTAKLTRAAIHNAPNKPLLGHCAGLKKHS